MKPAFVLLVMFAAAGCRSATGPEANVSVTVDSASYHLRPDHTWYAITLTATIVNTSDRDVYISQECGRTRLARPKGDASYLEFGQYACAVDGAFATPQTLTLPPGAAHTERFTLQGSEQPQARPRITMAELTGPASFGFLVSANLRLFVPAMSPTFTLQPPS